MDLTTHSTRSLPLHPDDLIVRRTLALLYSSHRVHSMLWRQIESRERRVRDLEVEVGSQMFKLYRRMETYCEHLHRLMTDLRVVDRRNLRRLIEMLTPLSTEHELLVEDYQLLATAADGYVLLVSCVNSLRGVGAELKTRIAEFSSVLEALKDGVERLPREGSVEYYAEGIRPIEPGEYSEDIWDSSPADPSDL